MDLRRKKVTLKLDAGPAKMPPPLEQTPGNRSATEKWARAGAEDVAPPGREKQVEALAENPNVENPYAVAWASLNGDELAIDGYDGPVEVDADVLDIVRKRGGSYVLYSHKGKVLGAHKTKGEAAAQERAIKANQHADGAETSSRRVMRYDRGELARPVREPNGWLRVEGKISRDGIQEYEDAQGHVTRELRLPEEVFDDKSRTSFALVPLTNSHPTQLLDSATAREHAVGSVGEPRRLDHFLAAPLLITDRDAVAYVLAGRSELSCGYSCDLDPTAGVHPEFGPYDAIQRNIRGNHVAIVDQARAGHEARIRLDSGSARMVASSPQPRTDQEKTPMPKALRIDSFNIEVNDGNVDMIQQAIDKAVAAALASGEAKTLGEKQRADAVAKERDALKKKLDQARKNWRLIVRKRADAKKAMMVGCDECGGLGKVTGEDGEQRMCGYCDGKGEYRLHEAVAEHGMTESEEDSPDTDLPEESPEMEGAEEAGKDDIDEMAVEEETEGEAKKAHKDAAARAKAREKKRLDFVVDRRISLIAQAMRVLGADHKFEKTDARSVMLAVVKHVGVPGVEEKKLDAEPTDKVRMRYELALERADHADGGPGLDPADEARAGMSALTTGGPPPRSTKLDEKKTKFYANTADAWKLPSKAKAATK